MRLYKPKDLPKQRNLADTPPAPPPSSSPVAPAPYRLKRAAEAVSKQLSGHKAMVAQFKELKLPRPPMFTSKVAASPQTDRPVPTKRIKGSGKPQIVPKAPTSSLKPKQPTTPSGINSKSRSPTKPPGLGSAAKKSSFLLSAQRKSNSVESPIHSPPQTADASPTSPVNNLASTASIPATCDSDDVDIGDSDGPILFVSCFHSLEEDPELDDDDSFEPMVSSSARFDTQVAQIFGTGLGPAADDEILRRGEMTPPTVVPELTFAPTFEPMSAVVEWWEPADNTAAQCESKERSDESEIITPRDLPRQLPSLADYEYVASLGKNALHTLSLGIHKQSLRECLIKTVSNAVAEEERIVRAILEEQRIMREASNYPFVLGLMASFHDPNGFHLVSVSFFPGNDRL
jgi:hypothetical protein